MSDIIDRAVAAAIEAFKAQDDEYVGKYDAEWGEIRLDGSFAIRPIVIAVLEAMKEPTDAMVKAAQAELVGTDAPIDTEEVVWRAMISKAMEG